MNLRLILKLAAVAGILTAISLWMGQVAYSWLPPPASAEAVLVDGLFSLMTAIGSFIFCGVVGTVTYSVLFQRAGKYDESDGPPIEGNLTLEAVWTAIPILLVIWIAAASYRVYDQMSILGPMEHIHMGGGEAIAAPMEMAQAMADGTEEIEVHARQWVWEFYYPKANVTSTELHLPKDRRIKLALTSEDVLHGFYIPAFRVKQDVIPGRDIDFEFTPILEGKYRLRDSQYSGTYFAAMQADVVVESPDAYQQWLATAAKSPLKPGLNPSYDEYQRTGGDDHRPGWKTVPPAPSPMVNYVGS
ncbi:cytochrome c oxidase subunit II [Phormidium sp. FACHB-1136]|uniref:cytochrome c oxidase subunit II n=1 Tax=Phormidium sp. FACHB-1136 TaxID=2692848 RepID=UPI001686E7E7|nr:cytochrome c oxidase subunit II [Phormidium sp. FACHB-1136]MBD2425891.1 cytochrome c oxidase subunit II [Phormidium sp. FACHB-1136]